MRILLLFLACCLGMAPALGRTEGSLALPTFSVLQKVESFQLTAVLPEFTVKYPPILPNSEKMTTSNGIVLVRGVDYQIDFYAGKITIEKDKILQFRLTAPDKAQAGSVLNVTITYRALPFAIERVYKRSFLGPGDELLDDKPEITVASPGIVGQDVGARPDPSSELEVSGSQTFGISVGSGRAVSQNQELRINVEGKVSDNISVLAMLSDQDLPIQPEGTTENIQDIDQKLIRITHPNVSGTLGDFEGSLGSSEFIFFPRALEGVQVDGEFSWGRFHLIPSALPKGQSTSLVIPGEEGRSEYRLSVDGEYVIVKAGSEIVWLNGEKMRRGENNDYVIREYGDPIIEFNSKHLITRNDVIRVDFEYIPEDRAYQQNLYGINSVFTLPGDRFSFGVSYAVETDLNQPEQALIILNDEDVDALRQNILDPDGDGSLLTAPQKHTVWGVESRLNLTEKMWMEGQFASSAVDKNTYSTADRKEVSQAWKLLGYAGWEKLTANLDIRAMDAGFVPVGASSSNRTRARYETQYAKEGFDDAFLLQSRGTAPKSTDETAINFDLRGMPAAWLEVDAGLGRSVEQDRTINTANSRADRMEATTRRNNFNWGVNFNRRASYSGARAYGGGTARGMPLSYGLRSELGTGKNQANSFSDSEKERGTEVTRSDWRKFLPNLRWDDYRSNVMMQSEDAEETFRKSRQEGNLAYPLGPFEMSGTLGRLASNDAQNAIRNRRRTRSTGRINLVGFKWASLNTSYELESAFAKEALLALDGEALGISDWKRDTTARTWKMGIFSQQGKWVNLTTNLARRRLKAHTELGTDTTTQLADIALHLTPLSRALDVEITYELDKKLTTQRREIYTDIHPHTGRRLLPGEGYFVKLDDLHYAEDLEEGTHIKIYQNVGDKPTTAIDAAFRLRFQPRQFFARRERTRGTGLRATGGERVTSGSARLQSAPTGSPVGEPSRSRFTSVYERSRLEWFLNALRGQTRVWLTEEQEAADAASLYLLQNLQGSQTLFGRVNQHYRLEFSPSPQFSFEFNLRLGRTLNRRINTQERNRQHRTWEVALSVNPTARLSVGINWEQRREKEKYSQLHEVARLDVSEPGDPTETDIEQARPSPLPPTPISDLRQVEQQTELNLQYQLSRAVRWSGIGGYKRTTDLEHLDEEPEAKTRTFSFENRVTYSLIGQGRIDFNYKLGYGESEGGVPIAQYYFYEGISHEVRMIADYRLRKFTDLLFRVNYRLLSTQQRKPEHRLEMSVSAEL